MGQLKYRTTFGSWITVNELGPRTLHVLIVDGLPIGKSLCFEVFDSQATGTPLSERHGLVMANAMNAWDPSSRTYTLSTLTLANQGQHGPTLEEGYQMYAEILWDATDGWVRAGETIVLYNDWTRANVVVYGAHTPGAKYDIMFNVDYPLAAGYTWMDAIEDPDGFIIMNALHEAPPYGAILANAVEEVAVILTHELGHYVFGMLDLYNGAGCYDAETRITIMGSNRDAREYDDEVVRCPPGTAVQGSYVPSWTKMRERFPEIPDRWGPVHGPSGDGGVFQLTAYDFLAVP